MYVDLVFLLIMYGFSATALLISIYTLWTLREIQEFYKKKNSKPNNAWDHYHEKAKQKPQPKGYWD
jgi:hypothetical protein